MRDAWVVTPETIGDDRGYFARIFDQDEFASRGMDGSVVQANVSFNEHAGTLRGMHFQRTPAAETKLVRCVRGSLYDVIVDLRKESPTFGEHFGLTLSSHNMAMLYVPRGCAHGYLTLEDGTEAHYMVSEFYTPDREGGVRYDDPALAIEWPAEVSVVSAKDRSWPDFDGSGWEW